MIFFRHGEATDNVNEIISDKEIYWFTLIENGKKEVLNSIEALPARVVKMYVSPFPRTIQTAHFIYQKHPEAEVVIDNRIIEIFHGKYSGHKNNVDLSNTRMQQKNGEYFVRLGDYGENRFEIETRLCLFLNYVFEQNSQNSTVMIVSHGSVTSFMERILGIKSSHIKTGKAEIFENIDMSIVE